MSLPRIGRYAPDLDLLAFAEPPTDVEPKTVLLAPRHPRGCQPGHRASTPTVPNEPVPGSPRPVSMRLLKRASIIRHRAVTAVNGSSAEAQQVAQLSDGPVFCGRSLRCRRAVDDVACHVSFTHLRSGRRGSVLMAEWRLERSGLSGIGRKRSAIR